MKIVISSKHLSLQLKLIDFDKDSIESIHIKREAIWLRSEHKSIELRGKCYFRQEKIVQEDSRWDWVKKLVDEVEEQPIVLDVRKNKVSVIFDY